MTEIVKSVTAWGWPRVRLWLAAAAAGLLVLPFVLDLPWTAGDYVFAALLLFGSLALYEVATRLSGDFAYRAGAGLAILSTFLLMCGNGAVGVTDGPADRYFLMVPAIAFVGAVLARFRPAGLSLAMFAASLVVGLIPVVALATDSVPAFNSAFEVLAIGGFFVVLFTGSALLFREAARSQAGPK